MYKILLFLTSCILFNCASFKELFKPIEYHPINFDTSKEIYPAVVASFIAYGIKIKEINILKNEYISDYSIVNGHYKIQMNVFPVRDTLHVRINEVLTYFEEEGKWKDSFLSNGLSKNQFGSNFLATVKEYLANDSMYLEIKNSLLNNFYFNFLVMDKMTEVARERWIESSLRDRTYYWKLEMDEFEHNDDSNYKEYKYKARFHFDINIKEFFLSDRIYLRLYTNNDSLSLHSLNTVVEGKGKLKELYKDKLSSNYFFNVVDNSDIEKNNPY